MTLVSRCSCLSPPFSAVKVKLLSLKIVLPVLHILFSPRMSKYMHALLSPISLPELLSKVRFGTETSLSFYS